MLTLPSTLFPSTPVFRSRQRRDPDLALHVLDRGGAGEAVAAVHVHRAGAANPLAAGAAEGQRRVLLALDLDERVEDHRAARVEVDVERVVARIRSEEHTSELQSLMRISSAVFCLKK